MASNNDPLLVEEEQQQRQEEEEEEAVITRNPTHKVISQTLRGTTNLANLLPTGTFLIFQLLSPALTNQGDCIEINKVMTIILLVVLAISSFVLNFTDSYRDRRGNILYGIPTLTGLWVVDGTVNLPQRVALEYRIKGRDFVHGLTSLLVFTSITLTEHNTVRCFFPSPSRNLRQILNVLPLLIGMTASFLFVFFPTQRHGIGHTLRHH
ncbi:protein DMP4-like [Amaranthus tricolor]|uniref:protein DMP4-like n=1 Tax=Amaranthus tricolor TaxID=29722 RepID=UPI00258586B1|nr:protein DMP4-like [Amaranthus tricolor]